MQLLQEYIQNILSIHISSYENSEDLIQLDFSKMKGTLVSTKIRYSVVKSNANVYQLNRYSYKSFFIMYFLMCSLENFRHKKN